METYALRTKFDIGKQGYIADPYWPARDRLISIQKQSGVNRARSAANRRKALEEFLQGQGMTVADYERLEKQANEPFYRANGAGSPIIIPDLHVYAFMVALCDEIRSASRPCDPQQVRSRFIASPWATQKLDKDGVFERFASVTSGTGQKLSNQRGLRVNPYIGNFEAEGTIGFDPDFVDPPTLKKAIEWGGQFVGIGASRKMGWGRFRLIDFSKLQ